MYTPNFDPNYNKRIQYYLINEISNELFYNNKTNIKFRRPHNKFYRLEYAYYYGLTMLLQNMPHISRLEDINLGNIPLSEDVMINGIKLNELGFSDRFQKKRIEQPTSIDDYEEQPIEFNYRKKYGEDYRYQKYRKAGYEFDPLELINIEMLDDENSYYKNLYNVSKEESEEDFEFEIEDEKDEDNGYKYLSEEEYEKIKEDSLDSISDIKERLFDENGVINSQYFVRLLRNNYAHINWYPDGENIHFILKTQNDQIAFSYSISSLVLIIKEYYIEMRNHILSESSKLDQMINKYSHLYNKAEDNDDPEVEYYENIFNQYVEKKLKLERSVLENKSYLFFVRRILNDWCESYEHDNYKPSDEDRYYLEKYEDHEILYSNISESINQLDSILEFYDLDFTVRASTDYEMIGTISQEKILLNLLFVQNKPEEIINIVDFSNLDVMVLDHSKQLAVNNEKLDALYKELTTLLSLNKQIKGAYESGKIKKEKYEDIRSSRDIKIDEIIKKAKILEDENVYYRRDSNNPDYFKDIILYHLRNANAHGNVYISDDYNQTVTFADINPETGLLVFYATIPLIDLLRPFYKKNVLEDLYETDDVVKEYSPSEISIISK